MSNDELDNVIPLFREDPQGEQRQRMIVIWQSLYKHHGQTLTDPATADSLHVAAKVMDLILDSACAAGKINEEQRDSLRAMLCTAHDAADEFQK